jgi:AcrR family transcriptional regulator
MIKQANISRGSFYQYFENKEDCYLEMMKVIAKEKMEIFKDIVQLDTNDTLFDHYMHMVYQIQIWMQKRPKFYKISLLMDYDKSDFIQKLMADNPNLLDYFYSLIKLDQERGIIRSNVDPQLLSEMLIAINRSMLMEYFQKEDYQGMIDKTKDILELIKYGTLVSTGENNV